MQHKTLDPRLSLAYDLYDSCELAADIGTDHAHLPAALLQRGRCQHMILTDISESALDNARNEIIEEKCGMISIMGMGGRTIRDILLSGREHLRGASLLLSAHTDWHLIRSAVQEIGYHLDREDPCFSSGRYYLVLRARPGSGALSDQEIRLGGPLFSSASPVLYAFVLRRRDVLQKHLCGICSSAVPDESEIRLLEKDLLFYNRFLSSGK